MKKTILTFIAFIFTFCFGLATMSFIAGKENSKKDKPLRLGIFSMSLNVQDLEKSKSFYEKLGFRQTGGSMSSNYLIMKNENTVIGLFKGMFENNILTFNPGWNADAKNLRSFDDVRTIQKELKVKGIPLLLEADTTSKGPASIMLADPDGNLILFDQHR